MKYKGMDGDPDSNIYMSIFLLIILIFLNAIFASAEIAVISMNDARLRKLSSNGDRRARKLVLLTEQPARFLATIQVAITLAGLLQSAFAADKFADPLVSALAEAGVALSPGILKNICIVAITLILAYFNLVFGELVPKRIAMKKSEGMALGMSGMLYFVSKVFAPLVWLLTASTNLVLRLFGMNPNEEEEAVTEEEIRMMLAEGNEKGTIPAEENEMILNVFEFNDISVEEICTHRRDTVLLFAEDPPEVWDAIIMENRHTYYPICGEDQDDIIGVLDTKDYFRLADKTREQVMEHAAEKAFFIPEGMKANVLFHRMKQARTYFAVIIDEYGGMSGIITLHDLMEALVGDLNEKEEPMKPQDIECLPEGTWKIQGCADLEEVSAAWNRPLPTDIYDTFSGYLCGLLGRVPEDGETFIWENEAMKVEVCRVQGHMIQEAVVQLKEQEMLKEQ